MNDTPSIRRFCPHRPLPPYTYVPGKSPHPVSDPAGHSFGARPVESAHLRPGAWNACDDYLFGIDLFNRGYYWEAHEAWEAVWQACGRKGATADFLKALIKLAAAGVKLRAGNRAGAERHIARAKQLFQRLRTAWGADDRPYGLELGTLADESWRALPVPAGDAAAAPQRVFDRLLLPDARPPAGDKALGWGNSGEV